MKRLLAIAGGGIRGLVPALVLHEIEWHTGEHTARLFDMVAGTSVGGILACGLTLDDGTGNPRYSAEAITRIFSDDGRRIFERSFWKGVSSVGGLLDEKYSSTNLVSVLTKYLGGAMLADALTPVLVTAYALESRRPRNFASWRDNITMVQAAHATSAAPTYFAPVQMFNDSFVDGGTFAANPAGVAYAAARRMWPDEDLLIVSLGTGEHTRPIRHEDAKDWGLIEWVKPILSVVFDGVSDSVDDQLRCLPGVDYYRFQRQLTTANDDMDDASERNLLALRVEAERIIEDQSMELAVVCAKLRG